MTCKMISSGVLLLLGLSDLLSPICGRSSYWKVTVCYCYHHLFSERVDSYLYWKLKISDFWMAVLILVITVKDPTGKVETLPSIMSSGRCSVWRMQSPPPHRAACELTLLNGDHTWIAQDGGRRMCRPIPGCERRFSTCIVELAPGLWRALW